MSGAFGTLFPDVPFVGKMLLPLARNWFYASETSMDVLGGALQFFLIDNYVVICHDI